MSVKLRRNSYDASVCPKVARMNGVRGFVGAPLTHALRVFMFLFILFFEIIPSINSIEAHILYTEPILARAHILFHPKIYFSI